MLEFRRVLAFSSRVHSYLLMLYIFFAVLFLMTFFIDSPADLISLLSLCMALLSWTLVFEGVWIVLACLYQFFYSHVFAFAPLILTVVRTAVMLVLATLCDVLETLVTRGLRL